MGYGLTTHERTDEIEGRERPGESLSTKQQLHTCANPLPSSVLVHSIPLPNATTSFPTSCSPRSPYIRRGLDEYQYIPRVSE